MSSKETNISSFVQFERRTVGAAFRPLIRYELTYQEPDVLRQIHELLVNHTGVTFWFNHFGIIDGPIIAHVLMSDPVIQKHRIAFPIALHQYEDNVFHPIITSISHLTRLELAPIVIEDTVKKIKYKNRQLGEGLEYYFDLAGDVLTAGGVVAINPQSGRRASLSKDTIAGRVFMHRMYRRHVGDYGIVPIGLGKKDVTHYRVEGVRLDPYTVKIGRVCMASDLLGDLDDRGNVLRNLHQADAFIMARLAAVVPSEYLPA